MIYLTTSGGETGWYISIQGKTAQDISKKVERYSRKAELKLRRGRLLYLQQVRNLGETGRRRPLKK